MGAALVVEAASEGNVSTVAMLLSQGARVDAREQGFTPLLAAAQNGHTDICKLLLETGKANVKETTPDGLTPLLHAAYKSHTEVCKLLLEKGKANIEETGPDGYTALNLAAFKGNASTVALLLSKGAKVDTRGKNGLTPLMAATFGGHTEVCELLLDKGKANIEETTPDGYTALNLAASNDNASTVALLLSKGARVDIRHKNGFTPLLAAAKKGQPEVCKLLLETGKANVKETTTDDRTPLLVAAQFGHTEVCELLLENGSDLAESGPVSQDTALHEAAGRGHESLLQLLLSPKYKPNLNIRDRIQFTPLHCASSMGHLACVKKLLQKGADPFLPNDEGNLPIHLAAQDNYDEVVWILIEQDGCSPDQVRHCTAIN